MTLAQRLLITSLRFAGRHAEAAEVEAASAGGSATRKREAADYAPRSAGDVPLSKPDMPPAPADYDTTSSAGAGGRAAPAESGANAPQPGGAAGGMEGGGGGGGHSHGGGQGGGGIGGSGGAEAEAQTRTDAAQPEPAPAPAHPDTNQINLHDDPFAGLHSERLRDRLERDAFRLASGTAQDSSIVETARRLLPPELHCIIPHNDFPVDISPAARQARIGALNGEIPDWAKNDPQNDPSLLKAAAARATQSAAALAAGQAYIRDPAKAPTATMAAIAGRTGRALSAPAIQPSAQPANQSPARPARSPSADREM